MIYLDGQIIFAIICAIILAWLGGLLIAHKYSSKLLSFMQTGSSPKDEPAQIPPEIQTQQSLSQQPLSSLSKQNTQAIWRYRTIIFCISLILSVVITLFYLQNSTANQPFSFKRTSLLILAYAWPVIPCIGLLERWSRVRIIGLSLFYTSVVIILVFLNSGEGTSLAGVMIWLYGQQIPPLIIIAILTGPNIRALGPYLLMVFFLLISASLLGYQVLEHSLEENNLDSWIIDLAELSNAYFVFALFGIFPWLIAFFPLRYIAKGLANLYQHKLFSTPLYLLSGIWLIILLFHSTALSHGLGLTAYTLLISWFIFPLLFFILQPFLKPKHQPPTLLLLRVFREDDGVGKLFDNVLERWRYSGNTVMIAGKDLALRALEPDELFRFLNGHLEDSFITDNDRLQQKVKQLDFVSDPDGRFRINEFFCFDSTWKIALNALISKTGLVLMDLRNYQSKRAGCSYELNIIANTPHLQKIIMLFNSETDINTANHLLGDKAKEVIWIKDDSANENNLEKSILAVLLG